MYTTKRTRIIAIVNICNKNNTLKAFSGSNEENLKKASIKNEKKTKKYTIGYNVAMPSMIFFDLDIFKLLTLNLLISYPPRRSL